MLPSLPVFAALATVAHGCVHHPSAELRELTAQAATLREQLAGASARADAFLRMEFLGEVSPLPGPRFTLEILSASSIADTAIEQHEDCAAAFLCELCDDTGTRLGTRGLVHAAVVSGQRKTRAARFAVGDRITSQLVPWPEMPADVRAIDRLDDSNAEALPAFAAIRPREFVALQSVSTQPPDRSAPSRAQAIADGIAAIRASLAPHGSFEAWFDELAPLRAELATALTRNKPLTVGNYVFRDVDYIARKPGEKWPGPQLAMLTSLRDQLAARGIDLIVAPVPAQEMLAALHVLPTAPADGIVYPYREWFRLRMLEAGIEVVDLLPALRAAATTFPFVYYDAMDGHVADGGIITAAAEVARRVRRYTELQPDYRVVKVQPTPYAIPREHRMFPPHSHIEGAYTAFSVRDEDGRPIPRDSPDAPVLVIGDSFVSVPDFYGVPTASFTVHLIKETGLRTRMLALGGAASQMLVHLAHADKKLLQGVRVCVFLFLESFLYGYSADDRLFHWQVVDLGH